MNAEIVSRAAAAPYAPERSPDKREAFGICGANVLYAPERSPDKREAFGICGANVLKANFPFGGVCKFLILFQGFDLETV